MITCIPTKLVSDSVTYHIFMWDVLLSAHWLSFIAMDLLSYTERIHMPGFPPISMKTGSMLWFREKEF